MNTPTQAELAEYITRTGCRFEANDMWDGSFHIKGGLDAPSDYLEAGYQIRIALTPYGLPSHLPPHNPAGLSPEKITESGKYRAWSVAEFEAALNNEIELMHIECHDIMWDRTGWCGSGPNFTYRVSADTPPP